ncbi:MAG: PIN domain-containing protein [Candidatus Moranbacteria bacterium]|nr:PIN domain-containing protein [Candidatus Moranbacteria bacterium]
MKYLLDTNVIVRVITRDDESLTPKALKVFDNIQKGEQKAVIITLIIGEVLYVLTSPKLYNISREKAVLALKIILETKNIVTEEKTITLKALNLFASVSLDFPNCFLLAKKEVKSFKDILTFDKKLK